MNTGLLQNYVAALFIMYAHSLRLSIKSHQIKFDDFRGPERIRTAVGAFAELCLATRPQDRIYFRFQILDFRFESETEQI